MAKDLPYFKFFCSEWNDGDITLEDYKTQGLFINICSYYWSNECDITFTKLKKKFRGNEDLINELLKSGLIKECINDNLSISFLDEQKEERNKTSKRNSESGKASAEKRRLAKLEEESNNNSTSVEIPLNEKSTNKRREEKIREDKSMYFTHESFLIWFKQCRFYLGMEYNVKKLSAWDKQLFNELKEYNKEDFKKAFKNFSSDKYYLDNNLIFPKHFLKEDNFIKYLNQPIKKELTLAEKLGGAVV